ncbi:TadE/TadG family type IV pilus assembly protein [Sphingomonas aerophila]|uniref:Flp pilus assembly protein TadG n=1 Tax=Sphingomonas aerophila TaxID=1344948 RepID=A0A7W9BB99_9SPHN|nr:TadE/TadG family type IV pilus assembly protein [Sphingomonas aerophila]MBB5714060.1 Flp pilus assembly protein TadG [Sphingomonas aerophila]
MMRGLLSRDERGATVIEFGIMAPVFCCMLIGGFDIAHSLYLRATLQGVVQKTSRDSGLEANSDEDRQALIDNKVRAQVRALVNNSDIKFERRFYRSFTDAAAARAEDWTDTNGNGRCDAGEPYTDTNNNSTWDDDGGDAGQGGAKDKTVYTVTVTYPRMLPLHKFVPSLPATQTVVAESVLQNQPYTDQGSYTVTKTVRNCL